MGDCDRIMPEEIVMGQGLNMPIGDLIREGSEEKRQELRAMGHTAERWVGRFALPPWQRGDVWDQERRQAFIESIFLGFDLGSIVFTGIDFDFEGEEISWKSDLLLDGQQRLRAIEAYMQDEFPAFGYHYSEITEIDKRRMFNRPINALRMNPRNVSEEQLCEIYDRLNFGGVPHREDERAVQNANHSETSLDLKKDVTFHLSKDYYNKLEELAYEKGFEVNGLAKLVILYYIDGQENS